MPKSEYYAFNPTRSGEAFKTPHLPSLILELDIFCALGTFQKKKFYTVWQNFFYWGSRFIAIKGASKFKVDVIFVIFHEVNIMLEIDS